MIHAFLSTTPADLARVCQLPVMLLLIAAGATVVNLLTPKPKAEHIHRLDLDKAKVVEGTEVTAVLGECAKDGCSAKLRLDIPRIQAGVVPFPLPSIKPGTFVTVSGDPRRVRLAATDPRFTRHRNN